MRDDHVDALGILVERTAVKVLAVGAPEHAEGFRHDLPLVPVVGRRGDDFVGLLRLAEVVDDIHAGNRLVLKHLHQVAVQADGIGPLLKEHVSGELETVIGTPVVDLADVIVCKQLGADVLHPVAGLVGVLPDVVKQRGIIENRALPIKNLFILFVKCRGPEPGALRSVGGSAARWPERRFVEKRHVDGAVVKVFAQTFVVSLIGDVDKCAHRRGIEIVHAVVAVLDTQKRHDLPVALRYLVFEVGAVIGFLLNFVWDEALAVSICLKLPDGRVVIAGGGDVKAQPLGLHRVKA